MRKAFSPGTKISSEVWNSLWVSYMEGVTQDSGTGDYFLVDWLSPEGISPSCSKAGIGPGTEEHHCGFHPRLGHY